MFPAAVRWTDGEPAAVTAVRAGTMRGSELLLDRVEAVSLARKRDRETQRQGRVFNAKLRTIGIDKDALDYQVRERKEQERKEADTQRSYAADLLRSDRISCLLEQRQQKEQRRLEGAILQFRRDFQQPENRREFDLNDPALLRKQRGGLVLPGLVGEDPGSAERHRRQQEQMRDWSLQQRRELESAKYQQRLEDQQYEDSRITLDRRAVKLQNIEAERRRSVAMATKDFNLAMAAESSERQRQARLQEEAANREEILSQLQGPLLSESLGYGEGLRHTQPSSYKGMSQDQLRLIREYQQQQVEDRQRAHLEQRRRQLEWDGRSQATERHGLLLERQQARFSRQLRCALDRTNAQLASEQRAQKEYLEKEVFTNIPDSRYFAQFNTTSR
ncbi:RIB43A-like with coiled-coils protein 2 [Brienomyrus brachyistius]|uniref:RIB43A-like with coiled-coils protein 2 n=1 Tax=Brienomyrus brachyistius TaxID=42636 RepID=UPI0020B27348|nr:RIB43A-like with coiled-coils protein 2 [Brienomyrus brachyistius]